MSTLLYSILIRSYYDVSMSKSEVCTYQARNKEETLRNGRPRPAQDDLERFGKAEIALVVVVAGD